MNLNVGSLGLACVESRKEVVIISKAQYDAMKQALEKFGDKKNWTSIGWRWVGLRSPFEIIQEALETK